MYQIAVCDDEQSDLNQAVQLTERILQEADIPCAVTAYGSGVTLLSEIQRGRHFDLLLLDVIMDTLDGMALASHLKEQAAPPDIVFISTDRDMALLGYYVNAKRYLAKPLDVEELREALLYCYQEMQRRAGGSSSHRRRASPRLSQGYPVRRAQRAAHLPAPYRGPGGRPAPPLPAGGAPAGIAVHLLPPNCSGQSGLCSPAPAAGSGAHQRGNSSGQPLPLRSGAPGAAGSP